MAKNSNNPKLKTVETRPYGSSARANIPTAELQSNRIRMRNLQQYRHTSRSTLACKFDALA